MSRKLKPGTYTEEYAIETALACLKKARDLLKLGGASKAVTRVRLAITSADGALRHVRRRRHA